MSKKFLGIEMGLISLLAISIVYATFNTTKCAIGACGVLEADAYFINSLVGVLALSIVLYVVVNRFKPFKKLMEERQIAIVGALNPLAGNVIVAFIAGMPLVRVFPNAFVDSILFAVGAVGCYTLLTKRK